MRYESLKQLSAEEFHRLTGVKPKTFGAMHAILHIAEQDKHTTGGVPAKLALEDRLLMALEYWRRTFFHLAHSYGVSESSCWKTVRWIEDVLIKSEKFHLSGKKE